MIEFNNINKEQPYIHFKDRYDAAMNKGQKNIEAVSISSFNTNKREVESRFVNIKFLNKKEFIFFTNYNSPKSISFALHNQISALFFWPNINIQIRIQANIKKTSLEFNENYFKGRSQYKNALAISSNQSRIIKSYEDVIRKYEEVKNKNDLELCPSYWGGFSFEPYTFEFWEGHKSRLNKRDFYIKRSEKWHHSILEP